MWLPAGYRESGKGQRLGVTLSASILSSSSRTPVYRMRIDGGVCENQKRKPMYFSENEAKHTLYSLGFIRKGERERERKKEKKE